MLELKQGKKKADEEITLSEVQKPGNAALPRPNALELQQTAQLTNLSQVEVIWNWRYSNGENPRLNYVFDISSLFV